MAKTTFCHDSYGAVLPSHVRRRTAGIEVQTGPLNKQAFACQASMERFSATHAQASLDND
jgi:hypothetical protein